MMVEWKITLQNVKNENFGIFFFQMIWRMTLEQGMA